VSRNRFSSARIFSKNPDASRFAALVRAGRHFRSGTTRTKPREESNVRNLLWGAAIAVAFAASTAASAQDTTLVAAAQQPAPAPAPAAPPPPPPPTIPAPPMAANVTRAAAYNAVTTQYVVANPTNIYNNHFVYGATVVGELARGARVEALAKVAGYEWVLVGRNGQGIGYVPISMLSPANLYVP
jgi:hypothetical protein